MAMHIKQISETNSEYLVPNEEEKSKPSGQVLAFNYGPSEEDKNMGLEVESENKNKDFVRRLIKPKRELMEKENTALMNAYDELQTVLNKYLNTEHLGGISQLLKDDKSYNDFVKKAEDYLMKQSHVLSESFSKSLPKLAKDFVNKYIENKESK